MARIYFDWNSTTIPLPAALDAMMNAYRTAWGNPASAHAEGRASKASLDASRSVVAQLAGAAPEDVIFTSGGTEASNLALYAPFMRQGVPTPSGAVLVAPIEHSSILSVAARLAKFGVEVRFLRVLPSGIVDVEDVRRQLARGGVRLVILQAVNGETGCIQPIGEVSALAHAHGALMHIDVIQAVGRIDPPAGGWLSIADTVSIASHKIRGPKGIGALATRPGFPVTPVLLGGSQERGLRPGTQDAALAAGFAVAAKYAATSPTLYAGTSAARNRLEAALRMMPGVAINGAEAPRVGHVCHASFHGWSAPKLVVALDAAGLSTSAGAACHSASEEPSRGIMAMWREHPEEQWRLRGTVRFSMPPGTTVATVDAALSVVRGVLAKGP